MGADLDIVLLREPHGPRHHRGIGGMKTAGDIGDGDMGHQAFVVTHLVQAEAFAHVAIDRELRVWSSRGHRSDLLVPTAAPIAASAPRPCADILINNPDLMEAVAAIESDSAPAGELISTHPPSGHNAVPTDDAQALHFKMNAVA